MQIELEINSKKKNI